MPSLLGIGQDAYAWATAKAYVFMDYVKIFPAASSAPSGHEMDYAQDFDYRLCWGIREVLRH